MIELIVIIALVALVIWLAKLSLMAVLIWLAIAALIVFIWKHIRGSGPRL